MIEQRLIIFATIQWPQTTVDHFVLILLGKANAVFVDTTLAAACDNSAQLGGLDIERGT
jgi:hypothetical protein